MLGVVFVLRKSYDNWKLTRISFFLVEWYIGYQTLQIEPWHSVFYWSGRMEEKKSSMGLLIVGLKVRDEAIWMFSIPWPV